MFVTERLPGWLDPRALALAGKADCTGPPGRAVPGCGPEQPPAVPELADLIPLATALAGRLASLEKTIAEAGDLSRVEQQLGEITALVDEYARQLLALKDSFDPRAGRMPQLKAEIESAGDTLTVVSKSVTAKIRTFGNLRKEWLAEQKQWNAWQAALLKDEPLEEITATMTKAQGAIDTALGLLRQQLKPLLAIQEQAGTLQTRINSLTAEVEGLISLSQGGVLVDASPSMFSARYVFSIGTSAAGLASKPGWPRSHGQERRFLPGRDGSLSSRGCSRLFWRSSSSVIANSWSKWSTGGSSPNGLLPRASWWAFCP